MELKKIDKNTIPFAFECMKELRGEAKYSYEMFYTYIKKSLFDNDNTNSSILIVYEDSKPVGIVSYNRFSIPRYLGYGYQIEEFVIHSKYQGRGYAKRVVKLFLEFIKEQDDYYLVRKVVVGTDSTVADRLYNIEFTKTEESLYSKSINHI
jgi:RimJ/RimL family protein N-acetyltransferase